MTAGPLRTPADSADTTPEGPPERAHAPGRRSVGDDLDVGRASWRRWGTGVAVAVTPSGALEDAARLLREALDAMDAACNRFRADSDLSTVNRHAGRPVRVGALCMEAIEVARLAAERTGGAVDPTVGTAICALGYDRDFDELAAEAPADEAAGGPLDGKVAGPAAWPDGPPSTRPVAGWRSIVLDPDRGTVVVPRGVALDLGATAKALCADRAAQRIAGELGCGVVVDLGGDLAVGGSPPRHGWQVAVVEDARRHVVPDADHEDPTVSLWRGGLASSGTSVRTWRRGGRQLHHIVDPATGWPAPAVWRQVTVAATSCVAANTASTAAIVWGADGPFRVGQMGLAARFVPADGGEPLEVGGWPAPAPAPAPRPPVAPRRTAERPR